MLQVANDAPVKAKANPKSKNLKYEVVEITPSIAAAWLDKNTANRKMSSKTKSAYQRDMKSGNWRLTGDPIRFDVNGRLIDGQHRLRACVDAGCNFSSLVIYGLAPDDQDVIDAVRPRTTKDVLAMHGYASANMLAAVAKLIVTHKTATNEGTLKLTNSEILKIVSARPELPKSCAMAWRAPTGIPRSQLAFIHYVGSHVLQLPEQADEFVKVFATGIPAYEGDPAHRLRERLIRHGDTRNMIARGQQIKSFIHAWNLFKRRESIDMFKVPKTVVIAGLDLKKL